MASGDVVYSKTSVDVASMSVSHFGSNGWNAVLNKGGTSTPRDDININVVLSNVSGAPFDVTKQYDIEIKEH